MPRWIGVAGAAGAVLQFVPLPVMPFLIGLQIELLRGAMIVGLGMLAVRSTSVDTSTDTREPVAAS